MTTQTADKAPNVLGPITREQANRLNAAGNDSARALLTEMGIEPTSDSDLVSFTNAQGQVEGYASTHPGDEGTFLGKKTIASKGLPLDVKDHPARAALTSHIEQGNYDRLLAAGDSVRAASEARASEGLEQANRPLQEGGITEVPKL